MANIYISGSECEVTPEWYWDENIADSKINKVEYIGNALKISFHDKLRTTNMKSMMLYDYDIICGMENLENYWILQETLTQSDSQYELEWIVTQSTKEHIVRIKFSHAAVEYDQI